MNDQVLFQDADVTVTPTQLVYRNNHYPLQSIKSVVYFKEPLDVKAFRLTPCLRWRACSVF